MCVAVKQSGDMAYTILSHVALPQYRISCVTPVYVMIPCHKNLIHATYLANDKQYKDLDLCTDFNI